MMVMVRRGASDLALTDTLTEAEIKILVYIDAAVEYYGNSVTMYGIKFGLRVTIKETELALSKLLKGGYISASRYNVDGQDYPIYSTSSKGIGFISGSLERCELRRITMSSFR